MKLSSCLNLAIVACAFAVSTGCAMEGKHQQRLLRLPYRSAADGQERDYFLYLPIGYEERSCKEWPVLIYLHGDGERGNGKKDLDYVLGYGPLYEVWVQKRDLPFIIVVPQLPMFGLDGPGGPDYIRNRTPEGIPRRLAEGVPARPDDMPALQIVGPMRGAIAAEKLPPDDFSPATGWRKTDPDLITVLDSVLFNYRADKKRVYLSGASSGGFGVWYYASRYPEKFAALLPVSAYPSGEQAEAVARADIPVWVFSGGRDSVVETKHFFIGMNIMDQLGATLRFTTEQDMFHDVWNRVYAGEDVYNWLLQHEKQ